MNEMIEITVPRAVRPILKAWAADFRCPIKGEYILRNSWQLFKAQQRYYADQRYEDELCGDFHNCGIDMSAEIESFDAFREWFISEIERLAKARGSSCQIHSAAESLLIDLAHGRPHDDSLASGNTSHVPAQRNIVVENFRLLGWLLPPDYFDGFVEQPGAD